MLLLEVRAVFTFHTGPCVVRAPGLLPPGPHTGPSVAPALGLLPPGVGCHCD
jgi:hypothetical protein